MENLSSKAAQTLNAVREKKPLIHNLIAACVYFLPPQQGPVMFIGKNIFKGIGAGEALSSIFSKKDGTAARYFRIINHTEAIFNGNRNRHLKILFCYMSLWLY